MIYDERLGTAEAIRHTLSPPVLALFDALRAILSQVDDQSTETASIKEKALYYTLGRGKMTDGYAYIMALKDYVNLGFFEGVHLHDPEARLEGTGKKLRHIKIRTTEDVMKPSTRALIEAAFGHMLQAKGRP